MNSVRTHAAAVAALLLGCAGVAAVGAGLDPEVNTDGFNPAARAYQIGEARRLELIARQIGLNNWLSWCDWCEGEPVDPEGWHYQPRWPMDQPIGHESRQTGPTTWTYRPLYLDEHRGEELPTPAPEPADHQPDGQVPKGAAFDGPQLPAPPDVQPKLPVLRRKSRPREF